MLRQYTTRIKPVQCRTCSVTQSTCPATAFRRTAATYTSPQQAQQISVLRSKIDTQSSSYTDNRKATDVLLQRFEKLHKEAALGGPESARAKHVGKGKMLVREYVALA